MSSKEEVFYNNEEKKSDEVKMFKEINNEEDKPVQVNKIKEIKKEKEM